MIIDFPLATMSFPLTVCPYLLLTASCRALMLFFQQLLLHPGSRGRVHADAPAAHRPGMVHFSEAPMLVCCFTRGYLYPCEHI